MWDFEISVLHGERHGAEKHKTLADPLWMLASHCAGSISVQEGLSSAPCHVQNGRGVSHGWGPAWTHQQIKPHRSSLLLKLLFGHDSIKFILCLSGEKIMSESRGNLDNLALAECEFCSSASFLIPSLKGCQRKRVLCSVQVTKSSCCYAAEPKIKVGDSAVLLKLRLKQGSINLFLARGQHCPTSLSRGWQVMINSVIFPLYPQ